MQSHSNEVPGALVHTLHGVGLKLVDAQVRSVEMANLTPDPEFKVKKTSAVLILVVIGGVEPELNFWCKGERGNQGDYHYSNRTLRVTYDGVKKSLRKSLLLFLNHYIEYSLHRFQKSRNKSHPNLVVG